MNKLDILKQNLYKLAADDKDRDEMDRIFAQEIEIPVSGEYDIESDPSWFDINDYMEK